MPKENDFKRKKPTILWCLISTLCFAFFLGFLTLSILSAYRWYQSSYQHSIHDLKQLQLLETTFLTQKNPAIVINAFLMAHRLNKYFDSTIKPFASVVKQEKKQPHKHLKFDKKTVAVWNHTFTLTQKIAHLLWLVFAEMMFKFLMILGAILFYALSMLLGILDGLVVRYVRTAEGGRESTWAFHRMTDVMTRIPIMVIFIFLISPILIVPSLMVLILALSFFVLGSMTTKHLKKFL